MKVCKQCGYQNQDTYNFCTKCASAFSTPQETYSNHIPNGNPQHGMRAVIIILSSILIVVIVGVLLLLFKSNIFKPNTNNTTNALTVTKEPSGGSQYGVEPASGNTASGSTDTITTGGDSASSKYIINDSASRFLSTSELQDYDSTQLSLARYEIFARHNSLFNDSRIQQYFYGCSWYEGYIYQENFNESVLNSFELKNLQSIMEQEKFSSGYILYDSADRYLTISDILGLSDEDSCLARNEIFARHGRLFDVSWIQAYFDTCEWYDGYIQPNQFSDNVLNDIERQNVKTIQTYEARFD